MTAVCKSGRYLSIEASLAGVHRMKTRMVPPYEDLDLGRRLRALLGPSVFKSGWDPPFNDLVWVGFERAWLGPPYVSPVVGPAIEKSGR